MVPMRARTGVEAPHVPTSRPHDAQDRGRRTQVGVTIGNRGRPCFGLITVRVAGYQTSKHP